MCPNCMLKNEKKTTIILYLASGNELSQDSTIYKSTRKSKPSHCGPVPLSVGQLEEEDGWEDEGQCRHAGSPDQRQDGPEMWARQRHHHHQHTHRRPQQHTLVSEI